MPKNGSGVTESNANSMLIIGGCGYIGSALIRHLETLGLHPVSYDLELRGHPEGIENTRADYRELTAVDLEPFSAVVLLAGHSSVGDAAKDPGGAFWNNIVRFFELVQ